MPTDCPDCTRALEGLLQEVRKMKTNKSLTPNVGARMERELQAAVTAAKKENQDLHLILGKLNGAKAMLAGESAASGLNTAIADTIALVKRHLP